MKLSLQQLQSYLWGAAKILRAKTAGRPVICRSGDRFRMDTYGCQSYRALYVGYYVSFEVGAWGRRSLNRVAVVMVTTTVPAL
jgi:hypothetical protein